MEQRTDRLYPFATLERDDVEQRIEKKLNDVNSFQNSINNKKVIITYLKEKNNNSKKIYKKYNMLTAICNSFGMIVNFATTSNSITLSLTGIGLVAIPISSGIP